MSVPLRDRLLSHHREMEQAYVALQDACDAGADGRTVGRLWSRFADGLKAHMRFEEEHLIPLARQTHPDAVAPLLAEHDRFRARLDTMGVELDLHVLRAWRVDDFLGELRAHAAAEDRGLYRWVEEGTGVVGRLGLRLALDKLDAGAAGASTG